MIGTPQSTIQKFSSSLPLYYYTIRVSANLKEGASKVRERTHNERLSKEVSHSSCTLLGIWLKPWSYARVPLPDEVVLVLPVWTTMLRPAAQAAGYAAPMQQDVARSLPGRVQAPVLQDAALFLTGHVQV